MAVLVLVQVEMAVLVQVLVLAQVLGHPQLRQVQAVAAADLQVPFWSRPSLSSRSWCVTFSLARAGVACSLTACAPCPVSVTHLCCVMVCGQTYCTADLLDNLGQGGSHYDTAKTLGTAYLKMAQRHWGSTVHPDVAAGHALLSRLFRQLSECVLLHVGGVIVVCGWVWLCVLCTRVPLGFCLIRTTYHARPHCLLHPVAVFLRLQAPPLPPSLSSASLS